MGIVLLKRLATGLLTVLVGLCAAGAGKAAGAPGLAESITLAGSLLENPAAAVDAADRMLREKALPAAQTQIEDMESPPLFEPPPPPTPEPEQTPDPAPPTPAPQVPEGAVPVQEVQYPHGTSQEYLPLAAGTIRNRAGLDPGLVMDAAGAGLPFAVEVGSDEPQVLIMHTHTTESYETYPEGWADPAYTSRSTDGSIGVMAVGEAITQELCNAGIAALHDTTLHDYPSYNGSYARSNETVRKYLEQYPSIKVVLDVHRDAIETEGRRVSAVAQVEGQKAAQVMIICGADKGGNLPDYQKNLGFAAAWETAMESRFPGLTRPVLLDYRYYNQDLTTGSLLIEVGSHGNTAAQAEYSGHLVGRALAELFGGQTS